FMSFARQDLPWGPQFSMTVLAIKLSAYANGVSKLHGEVSRAMWNFLWPGTPESEVPIGHVTNGVHTKTWLQPELRHLFEKYFGEEWNEEFDIAAHWDVARLPAEEMWHAHLERKAKMVHFARTRLRRQAVRHGEGPKLVAALGSVLNPEALTLGFARRFATYKRAMLIFSDAPRLLELLNNPHQPVQIVFAGKAHPADEPGKALIQRIHMLSRTPEFFGKIIFLEDYDMNMARHLVSGVDVWLNNPRRPLEASGTSGQKAAANGVPNFSALDGWWEEGYDGSNGWAIGESRQYKDEATQDEADALSLYAVLEDEIIPMFFERDEHGVPQRWVERMKNAIATNAPLYSMDRQVKDYVNQYYLPAMSTGAAAANDGYGPARDLASWKAQLQPRWKNIRVEAT
ncbi:MAG: alpha-glucan family phosphorylase, partial [Caldilineaceae bacterium]